MRTIDNYKKMPTGLKASIWFMFCSVMQKGITFLTTPIFTRLLSSEDYGKYSLFLSWQEVLIIFASLNLNYQIFNNGMIKYKNDKDGYTTSMTGLAFASSIVVYVLINIFFPLFNTYTGIDRLSLTLMSINMFATVVFGLWIVRERYDFKYRTATLMTIGMSVLNPVLGIALVSASEQKVLFRIISLAISTFIFALIAWILVIKRSRTLFRREYWHYALKLSIPLLPHYLSMVILHGADRIMIGALDSESSVAFYSISYNVALVVQIILNSINASFIPWVYQKMEQKDYVNIRKYNSFIILFVAIISVLPVLLAPEAVGILGGNEYLSAAEIIPVLSGSVFLIYLYSTFIIIETYFEKNIYITFGSSMAAILNIVLNALLIPRFGYKTAAYTTLASYVALAIFHWGMYRKALVDNKIYEKIFDTRLMMVTSVVLLLFSMLMTVAQGYITIRLTVLALIIMAAIIKRKSINGLLKKLRGNKW